MAGGRVSLLVHALSGSHPTPPSHPSHHSVISHHFPHLPTHSHSINTHNHHRRTCTHQHTYTQTHTHRPHPAISHVPLRPLLQVPARLCRCPQDHRNLLCHPPQHCCRGTKLYQGQPEILCRGALGRYLYMCVCVCACVYVYTHGCVCLYTWLLKLASLTLIPPSFPHPHTHTHTHTHTHLHTYTHTHTQQGGGGPFTVVPFENKGPFPMTPPVFNNHTGNVLDFDFNPFHENMIASGSEDTTIKIWGIPEGGLTENVTEPLADLRGHERKVTLLRYVFVWR